MAAPIIRIDDITKRYGALTVLDGLSMEVMPGEKLALIGPSGSGKTTILRILMTLETISGGHIEVDGDQLYHMQAKGGLVPADERQNKRCAERGAVSSGAVCAARWLQRGRPVRLRRQRQRLRLRRQLLKSRAPRKQESRKQPD